MTLLRPARRYRHNWALLDRRVIGDPADPLMIRYRLIRVPAFGIFVHRIRRPDNDRAVHDHPWPFASLILRGAYDERLTTLRSAHAGIPPRTVRRGRWSFHRMQLHQAHYISAVHGRLTTFVFVGRRRQDWGFYERGMFAHWRDFERQHPERVGALGPDPFDS
jgi:hypothetical protein